ncbi:MAG: hypothetical protein ACE5RJ_01005 [Nitrosopumilaceae archaeon]
MNIKNFLEKFSPNDFPVGLGGCKNSEHSYNCCEYNITIFDGKKQEDSIEEFENELVKIHHASLNETNSNILMQFHNMKIILDEQWELQMLLSKIKESKEKIFNDSAKNCLFDSLFCLTKSENGLKRSDPFSSSWQKCAAFFIADAISILNSTRPSPTHMLDYIREFKKNRINEKFSVINQCIGIERATPSLLSRMCKSTIGFSNMVEKNNYSKIIQVKYNYLIKNSLLSDCYFYLGYINRNNIMKIKDSLHRKPELIHILKVGFDIENDSTKVEQNIQLLRNATNTLMNSITNA